MFRKLLILAIIHVCYGFSLEGHPSNGAKDDHVEISEETEPLKWRSNIDSSKLAPESQLARVHFELPNLKLNAMLDKLTSVSSQNNTAKQSQDFDTHQHNSSVTPSPSGTVTLLPATTEINTNDTATTSKPTESVQANSTTEPPGWPVQTSPAPTETSTSQAPPTTTTLAPPEIVGSKTSRQGAAVLCGEANSNGKSNKKLVSDRIVGGYKTEPGEFPFQVRLNIRSRRGSGICGGVIIDEYHILTAAHCMTACVSQQLTTATLESYSVKATIGDHSIRSNDGESEIDVEKITPHEKYDACNFYANDHDIALIKTTERIEYRFTTDGYGSINRPCMPSAEGVVYQDGEQVIVSGWGVTRENSGVLSNILRYVQVPIVNNSRCRETYGSRVTDNHICAGLQSGGKDSCQGDSGGPLVRVVDNRYELVGIVSFGYGCGQPSAPGVYTRVASYMDWIKRNL